MSVPSGITSGLSEFPGHVKAEADTPIGHAEIVTWGDAFVIHITDATINRVSYNVRFDPILLPDGTYGKKDHHTLSISKNDSMRYADFSWPAYEKALTILTDWINTYAEANPDFVKAGHLSRAKNAAFYAWSEYDRSRSATQILACKWEDAYNAVQELEAS